MENTQGGRVVLLSIGTAEPVMDWDLVASLHNIAPVSDWRWAAASLETGIRHHGREVHSVVFDQSIDAAQFLDFLASLPYEFRGDILFIEHSNRGFLSSCTPKDGRVMYRLNATDIDFYIQAKFGAHSNEEWRTAAVAH